MSITLSNGLTLEENKEAIDSDVSSAIDSLGSLESCLDDPKANVQSFLDSVYNFGISEYKGSIEEDWNTIESAILNIKEALANIQELVEADLEEQEEERKEYYLEQM